MSLKDLGPFGGSHTNHQQGYHSPSKWRLTEVGVSFAGRSRLAPIPKAPFRAPAHLTPETRIRAQDAGILHLACILNFG